MLTTATGLVDAACYLGMGHVLVANMTGNVVFLGFALVGAKGFSITAFLVALAAFFVGAVAGGRLNVALGDHRRRWLTTAAAVETVLAAAAAIATAAGGLGPNGVARFGVIALLGVGMGVQNATIRKLAIPDLTTTVLTMTITGLGADSWLAGGALMVHAGFIATLAVTAGVFAAVTVGFTAFADRAPDSTSPSPVVSPRTEPAHAR